MVFCLVSMSVHRRFRNASVSNIPSLHRLDFRALNNAVVGTLSDHITFYGCLLVKKKINMSSEGVLSPVNLN